MAAEPESFTPLPVVLPAEQTGIAPRHISVEPYRRQRIQIARTVACLQPVVEPVAGDAGLCRDRVEHHTSGFHAQKPGIGVEYRIFPDAPLDVGKFYTSTCKELVDDVLFFAGYFP